MAEQRLLEVRKRLKARKPKFIRQDVHKKPRLAATWRKPKGRHSKMREHRKGHPANVSKGWKSPVAVKHLTVEGFEHIVVKNEADFGSLNSKQHAVTISGAVGMRKRLILIQKALERKLTIVNIKHPEKFLEQQMASMKERKERKAKKSKDKEQKKEVLEKAAQKKQEEEKKGIEEALGDEEKKKREKEEKDKILTKGE